MQRHPLDQPLTAQSLLGVPDLSPLPTGDKAPDTAPRVLVVASDPVVRAAFRQRLGRIAVGETNPTSLDTEARRTAANVVLWDLGTDDADTKAIAQSTLPVLALTSTPRSAGRLLSAGAKGVLRRDAEGDTLAAALTSVRLGLAVVDPEVAGPGTLGVPAGVDAAPSESLTAREVQVLELVAKGKSNKQIAVDLGISAHTVKFHVNAILGKMNAHTRTQAVVRGVQLGFIVV